jgi:UDP-glucose 4-epimerase
MARYLVTGIGGFIGSWIAQNLVSRGHEVRGLDNMTSGTYTNLSAIPGPIDFRCGDIRSPRDMQKACEGVDGVFHQAAIASVQDSIERPIETNEINHVGTLNLLQAVKAQGVRRVVFASSSAVYGDKSAPMLHEQMIPSPISNYGVQKLACEYSLRIAYNVDGVETIALRYFNVFGPRQSATSQYSGVIARFARHLAWREERAEPAIYGDGEQSRDFVYIEDVVSANVQAMTAPAQLVAGKVFNVGSGRSQTVNNIVRELGALSGEVLSFTHLPARPAEIRTSTADISAAAQALGYLPQWNFPDALNRTLDWYRGQRFQDSRPKRMPSSPVAPRIAGHRTSRGQTQLPFRPMPVRHV